MTIMWGPYHRRFRIFAIVLLTATLAAACSSDVQTLDDPTEAGAEPEQSIVDAEGSDEDADSTDLEDDESSESSPPLRFIGSPEMPLDPALAATSELSLAVTTVYESLYRVDGDGLAEYGVAADIKLDVDAKQHTITLRTDRVWSDGAPVVAQDFITAWERILSGDPVANPQFYSLARLAGAEAFIAGEADTVSGLRSPDDHTLILEYEVLDQLLPLRAINGALAPIPDHFYQIHGEGWYLEPDAPFNGLYRPAGPPVMTDGNTKLVLEANTTHPEWSPDQIDEVVFEWSATSRQIFEGEWRVLLEHEAPPTLFLARNLPPDAMVVELESNGWTVTREPQNETSFVSLNPNLLSPKIIEAIKYVAVPEELVSRTANAAYSPTSRLFNLPTTDTSIENRHDVADRKERGIALLAEEGVTPENRLSLRIAQPASAVWAEAFVGLLEPYGIDVEAIPIETRPVLELPDDFHGIVEGWYVSLPDPSGSLLLADQYPYEMLAPDDRQEFDALIAAASEMEPADRLANLVKAEELFVNEGNIIPFMRAEVAMVRRSELAGASLSSTYLFASHRLRWQDG